MARKDRLHANFIGSLCYHFACYYLASLPLFNEAHAEVAYGGVHGVLWIRFCAPSCSHCPPVPVSLYQVGSEAACHPHLVIAAGPEPFNTYLHIQSTSHVCQPLTLAAQSDLLIFAKLHAMPVSLPCLPCKANQLMKLKLLDLADVNEHQLMMVGLAEVYWQTLGLWPTIAHRTVRRLC